MNSAVVAIFLSVIFAPASQAVAMGRAGAAATEQTGNGDSQNVEAHSITVSRSGEAHAKPDLGILIMSITSTSPIADEAVAANALKAKHVKEALAGLGYGPSGYQISSVTFGHQGGQFPNGSDIAAYEADQYVYVFFSGADLADVARLTDKTAAAIEALRKAGAVPANTASRFGNVMVGDGQGALIVYTVKDPTEYERKALQVAIARARSAAQEIATAASVHLGALRNVQSGYLGGSGVIPRAGSSPLVGLRYRFFTTESNDRTIIANVTLQYDFN